MFTSKKSTSRVMTTWDIYTYDVWGNEKDGFEVNQTYNAGTQFIRCPVTTYNIGTPQEFRAAFPGPKQLAAIWGYKPKGIDIDGDDMKIYLTSSKTGYPIGEMRCTSHESLSPVRKITVENK